MSSTTRHICLIITVFTIFSGNVFALENLHPFAHAHNDYEHERPLLDALENHFYSVEADVWLNEGEILVAHDWGDFKGTLKELYLDPLQQRITKQGYIHNDGETFYLWIDLKDDRPETLEVLQQLFNQYPMLTQFNQNTPKQNPLHVILTGNARLKRQYVEGFAPRLASRDSNGFGEEDPDATPEWTWYALSWDSFIEQDDDDSTVTPDEINRLKELTNAIHAKGKKVRYYSCPDKPAYWQAAIDANVDLINTDHLKELNEFLSGKMKNKN